MNPFRETELVIIHFTIVITTIIDRCVTCRMFTSPDAVSSPYSSSMPFGCNTLYFKLYHHIIIERIIIIIIIIERITPMQCTAPLRRSQFGANFIFWSWRWPSDGVAILTESSRSYRRDRKH